MRVWIFVERQCPLPLCTLDELGNTWNKVHIDPKMYRHRKVGNRYLEKSQLSGRRGSEGKRKKKKMTEHSFKLSFMARLVNIKVPMPPHASVCTNTMTKNLRKRFRQSYNSLCEAYLYATNIKYVSFLEAAGRGY